MGYVASFVKSVLKLALYFAITGQLIDQTRAMMFKAHGAQSQMIRMGEWNRRLLGTKPN
jgi:hypothetical protein